MNRVNVREVEFDGLSSASKIRTATKIKLIPTSQLINETGFIFFFSDI